MLIVTGFAVSEGMESRTEARHHAGHNYDVINELKVE